MGTGRGEPRSLGEAPSRVELRFVKPGEGDLDAGASVTGDKTEIDKLTTQLGILYQKTKDKRTGVETIDHSGAILLIDPTGKLAAIFSAPHDPAAMAKDFQLIVANSGVVSGSRRTRNGSPTTAISKSS